ncbi:hypothetical protein CR513_62181, partial [Mucuna pruriens]
MTIFFNGLNRDIQDIVELHDYTSISILFHQASKIESQLRVHGKKSYPIARTNWKDPNSNTHKSSNGEIESESSEEETSTSGGEEYLSEEVPYEGDNFMVRRFMNGDSNVNVASQRLVEKLGLHTIPDPKPYKLQWWSEQGEMIIDKQV